MRTLDKNEVKEVSGGRFWIAARVLFPTIMNMAIYAFTKHKSGDPMSSTGLAIAGGAGLLSGGASTALGTAAGGGLLGAAV